MKHIKLGQYGEKLAEKHYKKQGFKLLDRNYRKKWGEIDLIFRRGTRVYFVEVKTISRETPIQAVSHETWRPEDNVDRRKLQKLLRTIETWLSKHKYEGEWQLDVASVVIYSDSNKADIAVIDNVILE